MNTLFSFAYTRRALLGQTALAALLLAVPSCAAPTVGTSPGAIETRANAQVAPTQIKTKFADNRVSVGYLTFSKWDKYSWDDIEYADLTHIVASFVVPASTTDPKVVFNGAEENFAHYPSLEKPNLESYLAKLTAKAHVNNVKVLVGVNSKTGENAADLGVIFADEKLRAQFVKNVLAYCKANHLDGVDLDYEYALNAKAGAGVTRFIADLRAAASADKTLPPEFLITMAVGMGGWANNALNYEVLKKNCDWFNVMTYDYAATWTKNNGFNAPLFADDAAKAHGHTGSVDEAVNYFRNSLKVPQSQIVVGLGFYGQRFDGIDELYGKNNGGSDLKFRDVVNDYLDKPDWKYNWSASAQVPYLFNEKTKSLVTYDDERSIAAKVNYVKQHDLRGVMIWEISRGFLPGQTQTQPLLDTIGRVLNAKP